MPSEKEYGAFAEGTVEIVNGDGTGADIIATPGEGHRLFVEKVTVSWYYMELT